MVSLLGLALGCCFPLAWWGFVLARKAKAQGEDQADVATVVCALLAVLATVFWIIFLAVALSPKPVWPEPQTGAWYNPPAISKLSGERFDAFPS